MVMVGNGVMVLDGELVMVWGLVSVKVKEGVNDRDLLREMLTDRDRDLVASRDREGVRLSRTKVSVKDGECVPVALRVMVKDRVSEVLRVRVTVRVSVAVILRVREEFRVSVHVDV